MGRLEKGDISDILFRGVCRRVLPLAFPPQPVTGKSHRLEACNFLMLMVSGIWSGTSCNLSALASG